jgi:uncharacterized membrane protein YqaE (UPF0057 family)
MASTYGTTTTTSTSSSPVRHEDSTAVKVAYAVGSVFLPPLVVGLKTGDPCETLINFGLLLLGWIPATIHSLAVVFVPGTSLSCFPETASSIPPGQLIQQHMGAGMGSSSKGAVATTSAGPPAGSYPQAGGGTYTSVSTKGTAERDPTTHCTRLKHKHKHEACSSRRLSPTPLDTGGLPRPLPHKGISQLLVSPCSAPAGNERW